MAFPRLPFLGLFLAPPQTHVSTRPITACEASWYAVALRCALDLLALRRALDLLMATPCCSRMAAWQGHALASIEESPAHGDSVRHTTSAGSDRHHRMTDCIW